MKQVYGAHKANSYLGKSFLKYLLLSYLPLTVRWEAGSGINFCSYLDKSTELSKFDQDIFYQNKALAFARFCSVSGDGLSVRIHLANFDAVQQNNILLYNIQKASA